MNRMGANALDRLVAAGKIRDTDRERVTFIVRVLVPPLEQADFSGATDLISGLAD